MPMFMMDIEVVWKFLWATVWKIYICLHCGE